MAPSAAPLSAAFAGQALLCERSARRSRLPDLRRYSVARMSVSGIRGQLPACRFAHAGYAMARTCAGERIGAASESPCAHPVRGCLPPLAALIRTKRSNICRGRFQTRPVSSNSVLRICRRHDWNTRHPVWI